MTTDVQKHVSVQAYPDFELTLWLVEHDEKLNMWSKFFHDSDA